MATIGTGLAIVMRVAEVVVQVVLRVGMAGLAGTVHRAVLILVGIRE